MTNIRDSGTASFAWREDDLASERHTLIKIKERPMIYRYSLRRILRHLYRRKADVETLICFFEKQARRRVRRRVRSARLARVTS